MNIDKLNKRLLLTDYNKCLTDIYEKYFKYILCISYDKFIDRICNDLNIIKKFLADDEHVYQFNTLLYNSMVILGGLELTSEQSKRFNCLTKIENLPNIFYITYDKKLKECYFINICTLYNDMINIKVKIK